jgi:hypothetical protein
MVKADLEHPNDAGIQGAKPAYPHQQVFSTGDWWGFEEVEPGIYRRMYMIGEMHYFHPSDTAPESCTKCELGSHTEPVPTGSIPPPPPNEQNVVLGVFVEMLRMVTADGGRKRTAGVKPPWWRDEAHEPAIFSHLNKWKHGETADKDSGAHPLVHLAWRALAIAYQETKGQVDPEFYPCGCAHRGGASCGAHHVA